MAKEPKTRTNKRALWIGALTFVLMFPALYLNDTFGLLPFDGALRTIIIAVITSLIACFIAFRIMPFGYETDQENDKDTRG